MALILTHLEKAIVSLKNAIGIAENPPLDSLEEYLRDSVIRRFEFTFELSWKLMKRWLRLILGDIM